MHGSSLAKRQRLGSSVSCATSEMEVGNVNSRHRLTVVLCVSLLCLSALALAQTTGEITGTVSGTDGRPLPGVTVEASSPSLQGTRVSVTGNDGTFRFISLPPGSYKIKGSLSGFTTVEKLAPVRLGP